MNKINLRLNGAGRKGVTHSRPDNVPLFTFPPVDLAGSQKFQEVCRQLWEKGVVSTKTMLQTHGYDMEQEEERKKSDPPRQNEVKGCRKHPTADRPSAAARPWMIRSVPPIPQNRNQERSRSPQTPKAVCNEGCE